LYVFDLRYVMGDALLTGQPGQVTLNMTTTGTIPANSGINIFATVFSEKKLRVTSAGGKITAALVQ
jgi:hypothetical protein